ncbi:MAG: hypothetical protein Kow00124_03360 [Anaerolineae bacterium]
MSQPANPQPPDIVKPPRKVPRWRIQLTNWQILLIALTVVGGRLVIDFSQRIIEGQQKIAEQRRLEAEIEVLREERRQLDAAKAYYSSPAFIEAWAHDEGKMVRDSERLVVPFYAEAPTAGEQPIPAPAPGEDAPTSPPITAWHIWWSLFFDAPPPFSQPPDL